MFQYYVWLGFKSLKQHWGLTILLILTLAMGVAASVSTLTILHVMGKDPLPQKKDKVFTFILDNLPLEGYDRSKKNEVDHQFTYQDMVNLRSLSIPAKKAGFYGIQADIEPVAEIKDVVNIQGLATHTELFQIAETSFLYGQAWGATEDADSSDVVVLSQNMAEKIFGKINPVGRKIKMLKGEFTVVGVTQSPQHRPRFFQPAHSYQVFVQEDDFFIPFSTAIRKQLPHAGSMSCSQSYGGTWQGLLASECTWMGFWLDLQEGETRQSLQVSLDNYVKAQNQLGRFPRKAENRIFNIQEIFIEKNIIREDLRINAWLALGFLSLCLINAVGIILAKYARKSSEMGVRRALGATQFQIFMQSLMESAVIGVSGSFVGLLLSFAALKLISLQGPALSNVATMDVSMLLLAIILSIAASIVAGMIPSWRACLVSPAIQLKTQ